MAIKGAPFTTKWWLWREQFFVQGFSNLQPTAVSFMHKEESLPKLHDLSENMNKRK